MFEVVAAHQPNFFPYLGFFDKLRQADIFVIRDEVLFADRDFHHRNKIRVNSHDNENHPKWQWIGVSVEKQREYIRHMKIKDGKKGRMYWRDQLLHDLQSSYGNAEHFQRFFPEIEKIVNNSSLMLIDLNLEVIRFLARQFKINTPLIMASELRLKPEGYDGAKTDASQDLVDICKAVGARRYLSGNGAREYVEPNTFEDAGVELDFHDFIHPVYRQNYNGFLSHMSAIDALFCLGKFPLNKENANTRIYESRIESRPRSMQKPTGIGAE